MTRSVDDILTALHDFTPTPDASDNVHRLNEALESFAPMQDGGAVAALFALLERFPEADFGAPGPLVQALEATPGYATTLAESLVRQPTELTAWMANRRLNSRLPRDERLAWLQRLTAVTSHPRASRPVRESAIRFLDFQASRPQRD